MLGQTETVAIALADMPLSPSDRRKIDRYLDATRAALLFARQVILVEGIAEAMLLRTWPRTSCSRVRRILSRYRQAEPPQTRAVPCDLHRPGGRRGLRSFVRLLLNDQGALVDRLVVITDGDTTTPAKSERARLKRSSRCSQRTDVSSWP